MATSSAQSAGRAHRGSSGAPRNAPRTRPRQRGSSLGGRRVRRGLRSARRHGGGEDRVGHRSVASVVRGFDDRPDSAPAGGSAEPGGGAARPAVPRNTQPRINRNRTTVAARFATTRTVISTRLVGSGSSTFNSASEPLVMRQSHQKHAESLELMTDRPGPAAHPEGQPPVGSGVGDRRQGQRDEVRHLRAGHRAQQHEQQPGRPACSARRSPRTAPPAASSRPVPPGSPVPAGPGPVDGGSR